MCIHLSDILSIIISIIWDVGAKIYVSQTLVERTCAGNHLDFTAGTRFPLYFGSPEIDHDYPI